MSVRLDHDESQPKVCRPWQEAIRACFIESPPPDQAAALARHIRECPACREYQGQLTSILAEVSSLSTRESAEPNPLFRERWRNAILESDSFQCRTSEVTVNWLLNLAQSARRFIMANRAPAFGLAAIWLLIFVFNFTSPDGQPVETGATKWSLAEVGRFFSVERQLAVQRASYPPSRL
jgi:anti-sigma factor RsiW